MGPNNALTFDKYEMCCSLLYPFNSVFTKPHPEKIVTNPSYFFSITKMYPNLTLSVLLMIHVFILKFTMYLIVTYCNRILIIYMTGHPLITF